MKTKLNSNRLEFLDALRAIAALSVILQHIGERTFPWFANFTTNYFQFGVFGVTVFFLCSGFIIPVSLEKGSSITKFWIKRVFRLYPLYIFSFVSAILLIKLGMFDADFPSITTILAQFSLLQKFIGQPMILGLYWTLNLEMVFYILVTCLFIVGLLRKTTFLAFASLIGAVFIGLFFSNGYGLAFYLSSMFVGTIFYRLLNNETSKKTVTLIMSCVLVAILVITSSNLLGKDDPSALGTQSFIPVLSAWVMAYTVFIIFYSLRDFHQASAILYFGKISYSLYLIQGVVLQSLHPAMPPLLTAIIDLSLIIIISSMTYYWIEKPFIKLGHNVSAKLNKKAEIPSTPHKTA